jgi:uncharacterized membrane protein (UPF0182 family)
MNEVIINAAMTRVKQLRAEANEIEEAVYDYMKPDFPRQVDAPAEQPITIPLPPAKKKAKPAAKKKAKRNLSPEARQRIADAQKKRWAEFRKGKDN